MQDEVTQADREAAAKFMDDHGWLCEEQWSDLYPGDQDVIAKAFARHRQQAERGEAEPVAYLYTRDDGSKDLVLDCNGEYARNLIKHGATEVPLYTLPTPPEAV